ncbi:MAG: multidrug efflux pump subunit AcrB [Planctomycetota bacterium]|jgi:multidrug efflux pump subunit AcrB
MIRAGVRYVVHNPVAANLATLALVLAGLMVYARMPREVFPDSSLAKLEVFVTYAGAAPEDVERLVTAPLEDELDSLRGLAELASTTSEGLARIQITLEAGEDAGDLLPEVRDAIARVRGDLPEGVDEPRAYELESVFPVIAVFIYGSATEGVRRQEAERIRSGIQSIPGIRNVAVTGNREPRLWIEVLPEALERHGLTLDDVGRAVRARSVDVPLGRLSTPDGDWLLRVDADLQWARDLADLQVLARPDGTVVRLDQVAQVSDTYARELTRARFNGQPCIHMQVEKSAEGDMIDLAAKVREYVDLEAGRMAPGTALGTNSDLSVYVRTRLSVMVESGWIGAMLVLASLFLFLGTRVSLVVALGIPVSFLGGLLISGLAGVTMNMITMFALIVVLGMLVDDAIVVGENIYRRIEAGEDPKTAAIEGTAQVGVPVLATILTSAAAFLPLLVLEGTMGRFLRPLPLVVSACLLVSLLEALFVLPAHMAHWVPACKPASGEPSTQLKENAISRAFLRVVHICLRWRYATVAAALATAAFAGGIAAYRIPFVYFDDFESKLFYVALRLPPDASLDETEAMARRVEAAALGLADTELESVNTLIGVSATDVSSYQLGQNLGQVWVELREGTGRRFSTAEVIAQLREQLPAVGGRLESLSIAQPQSGPHGRAIEFSVRGPEFETLRAISAELRASLESFAGTREVRDNLGLGKREVRVELTDAGRILGLSEASLAAELPTAFEGTTVGHLRRGLDDVELVVKLPEYARESRAALDDLRVALPGGGRVPLSRVARLVEGSGPAVISHANRRRTVIVTADVDKAEGNAEAIAAATEAAFADLASRYPGYTLLTEGDAQDTADSLAGLRVAGLVSLAVIFAILGTLFRSYTQPLVIMLVIPLSTIGMVLGHWVMGRPITMMSLIGLLALFGVVVNDSLILVEFVNAERRAGRPLFEALVRASRLRFRPIILTTVTTMLGLSPLVFFVQGQARFLQPMAIAVFFGLAVATALVLVVVPCAYHILDDMLSLPRRLRGGKKS